MAPAQKVAQRRDPSHARARSLTRGFRFIARSNWPIKRIVSSGPANLLVMISLVSIPGWGLNPRLALTQFGHDVWTTSNGLPQDSVRAITQTADGIFGLRPPAEWLASMA